MSEAHTIEAEKQFAHGEHLEVWPDAGITETAKPIHWWLILLYFGFAAGLFMAYWQQFVDHTAGYPKFGPGYFYKTEDQQYPGKIDPQITMAGEINFTAGQEIKAPVLLKAQGGRVGYEWTVEGRLPPGIRIEGTPHGMGFVGTPTKAGEYTFTLICRSGPASAEKDITITVNGAEAK